MTIDLRTANRLEVPTHLAEALHEAVQTLPDFEYYALVDTPEQQAQLRQAITQRVPQVQAFAQGLRTQLTAHPYFLWLRGLNMDERGLVLIALSVVMGRLRRHRGNLKKQALPNSPEQVELKPTYFNERMHTDGMHWPDPNDLTCIVCLAPDQHGGGASLVLDVDTILEMIESDEALRHVLREVPIPFTTTFDDRVETHYHPIIDEEKRLRWYLKNIEAAINWGQGELDREHLKLLRRFEAMIESAPQRYQFMLAPHDLLIVNNRKTLHGRTEIRNPLTSERRLVRTRLSLH